MYNLKDYKDYRYVHSVIHRNNNEFAIIANLKNIHTHESKLHVIDPVVRNFYITKPEYQSHNRKKTFEYLSKLDMYTTEQQELSYAVAKALDMPARGYIPLDKIYSSPYLYGADIDPRVTIKQDLNLKVESVLKYNVGTYDIEQFVGGTNEISLITYSNSDGQIFTAIHKKFLRDNTEEDIRRVLIEKRNVFRDQLNKEARAVFDSIEFKYTFYISDNELNLIKWSFSNIHRLKPDFISIWNMGYDIPTTIERISFRGGNPAAIMCHPDVPERYRVCKFKPDTRKHSHWSFKWDWFSLAGYTQFIDSQSLYSLSRKAKGIEPSLALEVIARKVIGTGKVEASEGKTHYQMHLTEFVNYTVYNVFDSVILILMDNLLQDIFTMATLSTTGLLSDFNKQTIQVKNDFYWYCRNNKAMVNTSIGQQTNEEDSRISKVGGNVLSPLLIRNMGIPILEESNIDTSLLKYVIDIDVALRSGAVYWKQCM